MSFLGDWNRRGFSSPANSYIGPQEVEVLTCPVCHNSYSDSEEPERCECGWSPKKQEA